MKIIDETGVELTEAPDLSLGRLIDDVEIVHHEAIAGVKQVSHFVPIVDPQPAWEETVPIQRYIRYTEDELAERRAKEEHEAKMEQMPETLAALKNENEMLKQCLLEMSETVYA